MARNFISARDKLSPLRLSETERKLYQQSLALARDGEQAQRGVVELVSQDRLKEATQLLIT